ncbi:PLP-dependent cysteine synthase family protein [Leifsonia shinshuensis]|uniref:Cystathionine beta-synthase/cysteine synthase A n=1 Tax=Leifsonia shinshuensis TaxID=150026 RepID=A0A853CW01_9MICO|nr:cysteine synthase family protein [Leifsonia shinshuensis]NYJ23374.1 cystathionine beta-synthase/cysteine synthase A [Leifsonia shinshuensis]
MTALDLIPASAHGNLPLGEVCDSAAALIGNTPIVELHALPSGLDVRVLVKLEGRNPGGSSKDRIALNMIRTAEAAGALAPGGTIVEATSGNTGIGLALIGRLTGHPVVIVHAADISEEKRKVLAAYGARLVEADWEAGPDDPANPRAIADRIAAETPGSWRPAQFANTANPEAHYRGTGPEIWRQTAGRVTHFVAAIGTGGTVSGTGRYLKEVSGGAVEVHGANPAGSTYDGGAAGRILVDGVGTAWPREFWPQTFDPEVVDEVHTVEDGVVYRTLRRLAAEEALLLGPSSALAVATALRVAREARPGSVIVAIAPDGGTNYLTKAYDADWLTAAGVGVD